MDSKEAALQSSGYVSGDEEFELAPEKLVLMGEGVEEVNSDAPFVDAEASAPDEPLPISEVVDYVENGNKVVDSDGDFDAGDGSGIGALNTESNLVNKVDVNSNGVVENGVFDGNEGNLVVDEVEMKGKEAESKEKGEIANEDEVGKAEAKDKVPEVASVELKNLELVDTGDVELNAEGDSVVDTIQVDVAGPGVVFVGEKEESKDVVDKSEAENSAAPILPEEPKFFDRSDTDQGDSVFDAIQIDMADPGVAVVGLMEESNNGTDKPEAEDTIKAAVFVPGESKLVDTVGDVKLTDQQDFDVAGPDVALVGETAENNVVAENTNEAAVFEPEESKFVDRGDVKLTNQGDSVVDAIQIDVAGPGVVVVGVMEENENDSKIVQEEAKFIDASNVEFTTGGDSVDTIQIDVADQDVVVVGETDEKFSGKIDEVEAPLESSSSADESSGGVEESAMTREITFNHQSLEPSMENSGQESARTRDITFDHQSLEPSMENSGQELGLKQFQPENHVVEDENLGDSINGSHAAITSNDSEAINNDGIAQSNGELSSVYISNGELSDELSEEPKSLAPAAVDAQEIAEVKDDMDEEVDPEDSDTDGMVFGSSEAARKFIEELEQGSEAEYSHANAGGSLDQSQRIDGQIVTDSEEEEEEEGDSDEEGDGKELFDSAALAALLKAATGHDSEGGNITITSQDGSRLFSVERPAGLGSSLRSLRPTPRTNRPILFNPLGPTNGESEESLSEDEKKKLAKLQDIRVKFLRLIHRLGLSLEESVAAQVLYRLALLGGRQGTQNFSLDSAKRSALQLEEEDRNSLDFSINILVLGKSGVGKSATINSIFGEEKVLVGAFETGTASPKEISGLVNGVKVRVFDTPGLKSSAMEQSFNRSVLSSVAKVTKKSPPDVVLYVDRLDAQTRDLNDLPFLKTVSSSLGPSIWRNAVVTLTHSASAPPDGPSGTPLSYEAFVSQRSHVVQQSIGHAVGDLRMMSPNLMNPVSLVENHRDCRKNREGEKILPNGQSWRPQLLLLCYSMKILSEASQLSKPQDPFDHHKLFGFRTRSPPLPYMLSSMLQSREHPKLPSDQGGDSFDSDIDLDEFSDTEEEDEYDHLPPFKPLRKAQVEKLSREQRKAYFEEYDYRVKLLQKKQWKEELRRMREIKRRGKNGTITDSDFPEEDPDSGTAAPVAVPLPDMTLPASFDSDNPAYRYRFLEPTSQFLARPVLDTHGWDHDCGYDGVNLEHSLAIASHFPLQYTVQITKDKKDFTVSLDSSVSAKYGENISNMAGFDIQSMGKQLAYIIRGESKIKNLKKHKAGCGLSFTLLGENVIPGVKIEDQIKLGKQFVLVGSAGAVKSQHDTAYGANFELQRRELDYPIGQVQSTFSMSVIKWRGDLALGFNSLAQFAVGRNSKVAIRAGINNKLSGQVTVRTSSSDHLSIALAAVLPTVISIYKKLSPAAGDKHSIY